jgi:hypothetical protein
MSRSDLLETLGGYQKGSRSWKEKEIGGGSLDLEMAAARSEAGYKPKGVTMRLNKRHVWQFGELLEDQETSFS